MNTIENNKLIAEFMGWDIVEKYTRMFGYGGGYVSKGHEDADLKVSLYKNTKGSLFHKRDLKFNISWDWLMPVVEKIESTQPEGYNTLIEGANCWIETEPISFEGMGKTKLEATYKAVVEFIKWYNENKEMSV